MYSGVPGYQKMVIRVIVGSVPGRSSTKRVRARFTLAVPLQPIRLG